MANAKKVTRRRPTTRSTTRRSGSDIVTTTMVRVHLPGSRRPATKPKAGGKKRVVRGKRKVTRSRR